MGKQQKRVAAKEGNGFKIKRLEEIVHLDVAKLDADTELWESGKLGASAKHAKSVSDEQDQALDDAIGLRLLSFRVQRSLIEQLKRLAQLEGIGYQPLMRQVLTRYVRQNEYRLEPTKRNKKHKKGS